jgi:cobalt/nickel transport protein
MRRTYRIAAGAAAAVLAIVAGVFAHFNVLLPQDYARYETRKGQAIPFRMLWGHGYEHIWFDATPPRLLTAIAPDGSTTDLRGDLEPITVRAADGRMARAFAFTFTPERRGDYVLRLDAAPVWDEEEKHWLQDYAKTVLHVQAKGGWERVVGQPLEVVALTRPYALHVGQVVKVRVLSNGKPLAGCDVEFEKFQPKIPVESSLPPEPMITFETRTDELGYAVVGMYGTGWFALTAVHPTDKTMDKDGHKGPIVERATLWIHVAEQPKLSFEVQTDKP